MVSSAAAGDPAPRGRTDEDFSRDWASVREGIRRFCLQSTRNAADADDLLQIIAVRAWRGYKTFTGDASFATWVRAIARNEAARFGRRALGRRESSLDADPATTVAAEVAAHRQAERMGPPGTDIVVERLGREWLRAVLGPVLDDAVAHGALSVVQADVLRTRAAADDVDWAALAPRWGLKPEHCAVTHFRAKDRLKVFLFRAHPEVLGGRDALRAAWLAAQRATPPLTVAEAQVFEAVVLDGRTDFRRRGWYGQLCRAVTLVARHTPLAEW